MSPRRPTRSRLRLLPRAFLALLVALAGSLAVPQLAWGQEQLLIQRELDYGAALRDYEARRAAWEAQEQQLQSSLEAISAAKQSGSTERYDAATQQAIIQAGELQRLRRRATEAEQILEQRRAALQEALDLQLTALAARFATAPRVEQAQLQTRMVALESQYQELRVVSAPRLLFFPSVDWDPRDSPDVIRAKVGMLEKRGSEVGEEIDRVGAQIARLESRLVLQRRAADAAAGLDRFDNTNLPTGAQARPGQRGSDSPTPLNELSLDQQIEAYRTSLTELQLMREQITARAASLRSRLPGARQGGGTP